MTCVTYKIDQKIDFQLRFILFLQGVANGETAGEHVYRVTQTLLFQ